MLRVSKILSASQLREDVYGFMDLLSAFPVRVHPRQSSTGSFYVKISKDARTKPLLIRFSDHPAPKYLDVEIARYRMVDLSVDPGSRKTVGDALNLVRNYTYF